jgi:hypothetical protein
VNRIFVEAIIEIDTGEPASALIVAEAGFVISDAGLRGMPETCVVCAMLLLVKKINAEAFAEAAVEGSSSCPTMDTGNNVIVMRYVLDSVGVKIGVIGSETAVDCPTKVQTGVFCATPTPTLKSAAASKIESVRFICDSPRLIVR